MEGRREIERQEEKERRGRERGGRGERERL